MTMTTFGSYVHAIMDRGRDEARDDGSAAVEAQHLLLAVAAGPDASSRQALAAAGLDREAIRAALDRELEHSLAAVGVSAAAFDLPRPSPRPDRPSRLGASARLAVDRGFSGVGKKALRPAHLLLGILLAEAGTVPRALDLAGVDRAGLAERVRRAAGSTNG
jgi:ATP-dependent Clp protease ATP-binding subunit ClpA